MASIVVYDKIFLVKYNISLFTVKQIWGVYLFKVSGGLCIAMYYMISKAVVVWGPSVGLNILNLYLMRGVGTYQIKMRVNRA